MSSKYSGNKSNIETTDEVEDKSNPFNISVNEITVNEEKHTKINHTNYLIELKKGKILSSLNLNQNLKKYPDFIFRLKENVFFKGFLAFRTFYRKIRNLVNTTNIILCFFLSLCFVLKLITYKNSIKPTGFVVKKIYLGFEKPDKFFINIQGLPLTEKNEIFDVSNLSLSINPLNTTTCWYKITSESVKTISTNSKETELCFSGAINPKNSLSNIFNEIKLNGCKIILQGKIYVTDLWIFRSTYTVTKEYSIHTDSFKGSGSGNELFYILNKSFKGEKLLLGEIKSEHLNVFDFIIDSDKQIFTGAVTPNMWFKGLRNLSFHLPNLEFVYKCSKMNKEGNTGSGEIKRIIFNDLKMVEGQLFPFKLITDDFYNPSKISIEHLYLKIWEENDNINLLDISIFSFCLFEGDVCIKQCNEDVRKEDDGEVAIFNIKEISTESITFTLNILKMKEAVFFKQAGFINDTGVLKIMSLDEKPVLLFNINYTLQLGSQLKNRQMNIQINQINWQLTLKGLKNGEEVQLIDSYGQLISYFSLKTFSIMKKGIENNDHKKANEYILNSWIKNITKESFEIYSVLNFLLKNEDLIKKGIEVNFSKNMEIKLSNKQFNLSLSIEKQTLISLRGLGNFDKDFKFKLCVFPKNDFIGFKTLQSLFIFKFENDQEIDFQGLSPRILGSKDVIGLFNSFYMEFLDPILLLLIIEETKNVEKQRELIKSTGAINWILYLPVYYGLLIPYEITPRITAIEIKSPKPIRICFKANKILFETFKLQIAMLNLKPSDLTEIKSDAFQDTLKIFINTYLFERSTDVFSSSYTKFSSIDNEEDIFINPSKQEIGSNHEEEGLLMELKKITRNYNKLGEEVKYTRKPKIEIKFVEKESNLVFGINFSFESSSNITMILKDLENSIFILNSHKYFLKGFAEKIQETVFKKFNDHLTLLKRFPLNEIILNIKTIEINSKVGTPILKIFIPNFTFQKFEIEKFEISFEVYLKGIYEFLEGDFLFEILVENREKKKTIFIKDEDSEGLLRYCLKLMKEMIKTESADVGKDKMYTKFMNLDFYKSFLQHANQIPLFNLLNDDCEIYVEFLYENIFRFTLLKQQDGNRILKTEGTKLNLDLLIARALSELFFYYHNFLIDTENNTSTFWWIVEYIFNSGIGSFISSDVLNILDHISHIEIPKNTYEEEQKIKINQTFKDFKTEITCEIAGNEEHSETKEYFTFIYNDTVLSFYINFQKNLVKNINISFEVSKKPLENSQFNETTLVFRILLSIYKNLYVKLKDLGFVREDHEKICLTVGQLLEFRNFQYSSILVKCGGEKVVSCVKKAASIITNGAAIIKDGWSSIKNVASSIKDGWSSIKNGASNIKNMAGDFCKSISQSFTSYFG